MKQTIEIEVPDGKKAIWKDNKVIFEDIKPLLPKTWKEFYKQNRIKEGECYINDYGWVTVSGVGKRHKIYDKNLLPNRKAAEAHLALMQLHQLRDCYRQGWKPTLEDNINIYAIRKSRNIMTHKLEITVLSASTLSSFLLFPTYEIASEFLTNFRELIEQARDLI